MKCLFYMLCLTFFVTAFAEQQAPKTVGSFRLYQEIDPITDENSSLFLTDEIEFSSSSPNDNGASFAVRCDEATDIGIDVFFVGLPYLEQDRGNRDVDAIYRFDKETPQALYWQPSIKGGSAFVALFNADMRKAWSQTVKKARCLAIRFTLDGNEHTHVFDLTGIRRAFSELNCK